MEKLSSSSVSRQRSPCALFLCCRTATRRVRELAEGTLRSPQRVVSQFLTVEEFTARFGPSQQDYDSVIHFAEANGFTVVGTPAIA